MTEIEQDTNLDTQLQSLFQKLMKMLPVKDFKHKKAYALYILHVHNA